MTACSTLYEPVMPFRNLSYSGERLLPIQENNSEKIFRVWFNNGTSVDRIITVSYDSLFEYQSKFQEIGILQKKSLFRSKDIKIFNETDITPQSGFKNFFLKIDSLNLLEYTNQVDFEYLINHQPFSLYVIEIKDKGKYNQFSFRTHFPISLDDSTKYINIEKLIFNEFFSE
jgi:hypothetical protein